MGAPPVAAHHASLGGALAALRPEARPATAGTRDVPTTTTTTTTSPGACALRRYGPLSRAVYRRVLSKRDELEEEREEGEGEGEEP